MGVGGQKNALATSPPGKTWYPLCRRWVGPRSGLDRCRKSHPTGTPSLGHPACSELPY